MKSVTVALAGALLAATAAFAHPAPQPIPLPTPIAAPQDMPFPGTIRLQVDATDLDRRIFRVRETIPVAQAGPMVLRYPQWLPGNHAPRGAIQNLAGLVIRADGRPVAWTRDPVDVYAFHLDVPVGARALELEFQFLSPTAGDQGRVVVTPEMLNLQWNAVALYPAGHFTRQITVEPSVRLPAGWSFGTALETASSVDGTTTFKPVSFETLVDSPMFAGRHFRRFELDPGGRSRVTLNIVADEAADLDAKPEQVEKHRALVRQADKLFGARHFDHYDFLLSLTERMGGIGLEHHRSSENGVVRSYFTDWAKTAPERDLLPHEYTHSWNGKFRRGADLWTPDFATPMRNSLLWVYEGQTQYWGYVLSARSGLLSKQETLDAIAATAALYDARVGRAWRDVADTTNDPIVGARRPLPWTSWQRAEDYYSEGQLIWLDADTLIRERSGGKTSLDNFARAFFGVDDGSWTPRTYTQADVVSTLNAVAPYDWAGFLEARLEGRGGAAPLGGLARGGYRLVYTETPTDYFKADEAGRKISDFTYSLGFVLNKDGDARSVLWDGPAYKAGMTVGTRVMAVNGMAYDPQRLGDALKAAKTDKAPIELLLRNGERYRTVKIDYHGGARYPRLERIPGAAARLDDILAPRK